MPGARVDSGERVTLRTVEREDVPFCHRADTNAELRTIIGETVVNLETAEENFENQWGADVMFLVCLDGEDAGPGHPDEADTRRIGYCHVAGGDRQRPRLGAFIVPEAQGDGYGREAVSLIVDYTFDVYHHPVVGADTFVHNDAARGLLESLGFTQEGRIRGATFWDGEYRDRVHYGLHREDWHDRD